MRPDIDIDGGQGNAMTEVALALAMGFFSLMVLTLVSMGAGDHAAGAPESEADAGFRALVVAADQADAAGAAQPAPDDLFLFYWNKRYFDDAGSQVAPATAADQTRPRVVLAVDPGLSFDEIAAVRAAVPHARVVIARLTDDWAARLAAGERAE